MQNSVQWPEAFSRGCRTGSTWFLCRTNDDHRVFGFPGFLNYVLEFPSPFFFFLLVFLGFSRFYVGKISFVLYDDISLNI